MQNQLNYIICESTGNRPKHQEYFEWQRPAEVE